MTNGTPNTPAPAPKKKIGLLGCLGVIVILVIIAGAGRQRLVQ